MHFDDAPDTSEHNKQKHLNNKRINKKQIWVVWGSQNLLFSIIFRVTVDSDKCKYK